MVATSDFTFADNLLRLFVSFFCRFFASNPHRFPRYGTGRRAASDLTARPAASQDAAHAADSVAARVGEKGQGKNPGGGVGGGFGGIGGRGSSGELLRTIAAVGGWYKVNKGHMLDPLVKAMRPLVKRYGETERERQRGEAEAGGWRGWRDRDEDGYL